MASIEKKYIFASILQKEAKKCYNINVKSAAIHAEKNSI